MGKIKNLFTSGKMNKDLDERLVPGGEYRDALNVKIANSNSSDVGAIENALSNEKVSDLDFGDNAVCIGAIADDRNRKIYWWVVSDSGCYLAEYSKERDNSYFVLSDTRQGAASVLNLSKAYYIHSSNIVYDSDNDNVFIYWTDGYNPPRMIEVSDAKTRGINQFDEDYISVIKAPPRKEPEVVLYDDPGMVKNQMEDKFFAFAYRYEYKFNQYSVLSPFSDYAFEPGLSNFDPRETTNVAMKNQKNSASVTVETGDDLVVGIEIYAKDTQSQNLYLIQKVDKDRDEVPDNSTYGVTFQNNKILRVAPETLFNHIYDNVPILAETQEVIGNRLMYGNYEENYDLVDSAGRPIDIDMSVSLSHDSLDIECSSEVEYRIKLSAAATSPGEISYNKCGESGTTTLEVTPGDNFIISSDTRPTVTDQASGQNINIYDSSEDTLARSGLSSPLATTSVVKGTKSLKSNTDYTIGIVYYDKYGRKSTVLTPPVGTVEVGGTSSSKNQIKVNINHNPPKWADRYKFAIKETRSDYEQIRTTGPVYVSFEDKRTYVRLYGRDLDKVKEGDVVISKHDFYGISSKRFNVIKVQDYDADEGNNSIGDESVIHNNNQNLRAGVYMVLEGTDLGSGPYDTTSTMGTAANDSAKYVFETVNKKTTDSVFFETIGTYDIKNGIHEGTEQDQTSSSPAIVKLNAYNCFSFGEGVESYKIEDEISGDSFSIGIRVNQNIDDYRVNKRVASITWSDVFDPTTNYNGLNSFDLARINYKDMDEVNGKIRRLLTKDNNIISFQENKVFNILFNKNVLFTADGSGSVSQTLNVLGQEVPYQGQYGISFSPASVQRWAGRIYFADERRGAVMRLSQDGLTEISDYGMRDWFADNLSANEYQFVLGGYDPVTDQYVVTIKDSVEEWKEDEYICLGEDVEWREDTYECLQESTTTTLAAFSCNNANFSMANGTSGGSTSGQGSVDSGTIASISPSTYTTGSATYTATINIPSGYANYPGTITCTAIATGSATLPVFGCSDAGFTMPNGSAGSSTSGQGSVSEGTITAISPSTYTTGGDTYTATITAPSGYSNAGSSITCTASATGTTTPPTTPTPTTPPTTPTPLPDYDCSTNGAGWVNASWNSSTGAISVTGAAGTTTVHSFSPTSAAAGNGVVSVTFTFSSSDSQYGNTGTQYTCTNLVTVDTGTTPAPTLPEFSCSIANPVISQGTVGDAVVVSVDEGSVASVSPSVYTEGTNNYTVVVTIPSSGYQNGGGTKTCYNIQGTGVTTTTPDPYYYYTYTPCEGSNFGVLRSTTSYAVGTEIKFRSGAETYCGTISGTTSGPTYAGGITGTITGCNDPVCSQ